jgi:hypothetical protein
MFGLPYLGETPSPYLGKKQSIERERMKGSATLVERRSRGNDTGPILESGSFFDTFQF